ncbi:FAD binding domain-containing protein [Dactylonectria estremocensis]|uniref:FAD binding domain-containing protein n=1 Tax=Dactylonectria estremocensis TaxID=1079267 RepID=A0A9P9FG66_9HYPO|nr:FAD binding domain-containing protein [Dactylonectria estremocensis]
MGHGQSSPSKTCLDAVCGNRAGCVSYPSDPLYQLSWVKPYNLDVPVTPAAVLRPDTAQDVVDAVKCATENGFKVQAKSGGHSYGNLGLGGEDGALALDLVNLNSFSMDNETWRATVGAGTRLGKLDEHLHDNGGRAMAHGTCPGVGIGGHATIGGLGPMSRMWGSALDHVVEVEVVTADGTIQRASETENEDLFWALRGAGASFGIITEFVVKTHPEPGDVIEYTYSLTFGSQSDMAPVYQEWQEFIGDPDLDRRFSSQFIAQPLGALITGTFYGTEDEYKDSGIPDKIPGGSKDGDGLMLTDWLGSLGHQAEVEGLAISDLSTPFYSKSLAFRQEDLLSNDSITEVFDYMDNADRGTVLWAIIFNSEGGAMGDTTANDTAYPHRDKMMMYQSYAVGLPKVTDTIRDFLDGVHTKIQGGAPGANTTYAGYIDTQMDREEATEAYWGSQLPRLRQLKKEWDPEDVFSNPQSVQPAK